MYLLVSDHIDLLDCVCSRNVEQHVNYFEEL